MLDPLATPSFPPIVPPPAAKHEHELPHGSGWYLSSYELKRGVTVFELAPGDESGAWPPPCSIARV